MRRALCLLFLATGVMVCSSCGYAYFRSLDNYPFQPISTAGLAPDVAEKAVIEGILAKGWYVTERSDDSLTARYSRGAHYVQVKVVFYDDYAKMSFVNKYRLRYGYAYRWISNLDVSIRRSVSRLYVQD